MPVDRSAAEPPWRQIAAEVRARITSGELAAGARLPSITQLMSEYGVARVTVVKALKALAEEGLIESRQGWGTFVSKE